MKKQTNSNKKKTKQLGMHHGTAAGRLKKKVLFTLIQNAELDQCYQCDKKIENIEDLSIEHKIPWLDSDNPVELYFDIDNIAFSHLKCNISAARVTRINIVTECGDRAGTRYKNHKCRCRKCKGAHAAKMREYKRAKKVKTLSSSGRISDFQSDDASSNLARVT